MIEICTRGSALPRPQPLFEPTVPRQELRILSLDDGPVDESLDDFECLGSARGNRAVAAILGGHPLNTNS
jgi:hypothetical protein